MIDFKEIPKANTGIGNQDTFEFFARDFFVELGYTIIEEPTRGPDGGIDIKIKENIKTDKGNKNFFWLVSCKHYAYSGSSISPSIEQNILDNVKSKGCNGFIGFYSTLATTKLKETLKGLTEWIAYDLYDGKKIERHIVGNRKMETLFYRYFPVSYRKWKETYYYIEPTKLFEYYFDKEYNKYKDIYLKIFRSFENSLKQIKAFSTFKEAVSNNSKEILIDDNTYKKYIDTEGFENIKGIIILKEIPQTIVPEFIKKKYDIILNKNFHSISLTFDKKYLCVFYSNYIVINQTLLKQLEIIFKDLKMVLE